MRGLSKRHRDRGLFITFEGPEGGGKSTQIRHLASALRRAGYRVILTREPGGTTVAEAIRHILLLSSTQEVITPETESLLILAARSQHVTHLIAPALQENAVVLCDRFSDSTFAYQGYARKLPLRWLKAANNVATGGIEPDLTLLFDLPVTIGLARRRKAAGLQNRLDRESNRFHRSVRNGFLALAARSPDRIKVIDANRPEQEIRTEVLSLVLSWVAERRGKLRRK